MSFTWTRWIVVAYGLAGASVFAYLSYRIWQSDPATSNGDRLRWPITAALAWAHLAPALGWAVGFWLSRDLSQQVARGVVIAALVPVGLLTLRILGHYLHREG